MGRPPRVLVLAGEESGDMHGSRVVRAICTARPDVRFVGLGGGRMQAEGVRLMAGLDRLAVMGFVEPIRHLPFFVELFRRLRSLLDAGEVDLVIAIDYPGFNMRVIEAARAAGVPVLYYIVPQFWAWKQGRVHDLARNTDRVAVILPFEAEPLREAGAHATFVGHPLLERGAQVSDGQDADGKFHRAWDLDPDRPILALLPGSRRQELDRHLELFVAAGKQVAAQDGRVQLVLARAPSVKAGALQGLGVPVVPDSAALLRHAHAALVKSGTSTLEAAVAGVPCVCVYRAHPLAYRIARRVVNVPFIALPNLIAGRAVIPELIQEEATEASVVRALAPLLEDGGAVRTEMLRGYSEVRDRLGTPGAADRVAALAGELLPPADPGGPPAPGPRSR